MLVADLVPLHLCYICLFLSSFPGCNGEELWRQGLPQCTGERHPVMRVSLWHRSLSGIWCLKWQQHTQTPVTFNKSLLPCSSTQAAECNQTWAGQEDQQTAHPHRWAGKKTLSSVTFSPANQPVRQSDKLCLWSPAVSSRTTCQSSCGAVRSWAWGAPSCLTPETCRTLPYEPTSSKWACVAFYSGLCPFYCWITWQ